MGLIDPLLKERYKPVTVLPAVNKVLEKIVAKQLVGIFDHRLGQALCLLIVKLPSARLPLLT